MESLKKAVYSELDSIVDCKVYHLRAPSTAIFPYVVYSLESYPGGEGGEIITLSLDGWDEREETSTIYDILENLNKINKKPIKTAGLSVVFYLDSKIPVDDEEPKIKRILYTYTGYLHLKEG